MILRKKKKKWKHLFRVYKALLSVSHSLPGASQEQNPLCSAVPQLHHSNAFAHAVPQLRTCFSFFLAEEKGAGNTNSSIKIWTKGLLCQMVFSEPYSTLAMPFHDSPHKIPPFFFLPVCPRHSELCKRVGSNLFPLFPQFLTQCLTHSRCSINVWQVIDD